MRFSPLLATFCVLLGLAGFAFPLWKLTSGAERVTRTIPITSPHNPNAIPSEIRLRLIPTPQSIQLINPANHNTLYKNDNPSSESYFILPLKFDHGDLELLLDAQWPPNTELSAAFLEISPEGLPTKENYATGTNHINAILHFHWHELHAP